MKDCAFLFLMASLSLATPVTLYFCLSLPQWGFWLFPLCISSFSLPTLYTLYTYAIPVSYPLCLFVVFLPLPFTTKTRYAFLVSKWLLTLNSDLLLCPLRRGAGSLGAPWGLLSELWTHHIPFLPPCMCYHTQSQSSRQILDCQSTLLLVQILRHIHSSFPGFLLYHLGHKINLLPLYSSASITDML